MRINETLTSDRMGKQRPEAFIFLGAEEQQQQQRTAAQLFFLRDESLRLRLPSVTAPTVNTSASKKAASAHARHKRGQLG